MSLQTPVALPALAADLTWVRANGGTTRSAMADWDEERDPVVGERVRVSDGGAFFAAVIESLHEDGVIGLRVLEFADPDPA